MFFSISVSEDSGNSSLNTYATDTIQTNERPVSRSRDHSQPIRGQYNDTIQTNNSQDWVNAPQR